MRLFAFFKTENVKRQEELRERDRKQREEVLKQVRETKERLEAALRREVKE